MATTFNFTVRAEDDQGAYADRDFSISVKNTVIDRYMIIDETDAYTSPDMTTWTKRNGQGGMGLQYGGGTWMISVTRNSGTYRTSKDGVNFVNRTLSSATVSGIASTITFLMGHDPIWLNGSWWVHCSVSGSNWSGYQFHLLKSSDGISWQTVGQDTGSVVNFNPTTYNNKIYFSLSNSIRVFDITTGLFSYFIPALPSSTVSASVVYPPIVINGLWIYCRQDLRSNNGAFQSFYSTDGVNWAAGDILRLSSVTNKYTNMKYLNGYLVPEIESTSSLNIIISSTDGKKWAATTIPTVTSVTGRSFIFNTKGKTHVLVKDKALSAPNIGGEWKSSSLPIAAITGFAMIR